jgi:hypothetical protein
LQPQGSIFDGDGLVTAQQESDESKDRQERGWHVLRLFVPKSFQVNLLRADAIMAIPQAGMFSFEHCQLLTQGEDLQGGIASTREEDSQYRQHCRNDIDHKFLVCSMRTCPLKSPFV